MRIPSYYCPHCDNFKNIFQVNFKTFGYECKHCNHNVIETEKYFREFIDKHLVDYEQVVDEIMMLDRTYMSDGTPMVSMDEIRNIVTKYRERVN